jgi:Domain of unknown function (DUF222)/HNH endonuclease
MEVNMRPIAELATEISTLAGHINAAQYRFLKLIAEFDRRKGWSDGFTQSCAHWLNWKCGIGMGAAREKVRAALALENLPKVAAAMETGALSYSKVREITRVATPETEDALLMVAEHGTASHVENLVRAFRRSQEAEELSREARQQESRRVSVRHDDDGSMVLFCRLPAEVGARLLRAIDNAVDDVPAGTSDEPRLPFHVRRADALGVLAESFLAHGAMDMNGGDRNQIVVHVAAETLRDRKAGCCEIEPGPSIAAETARRMSCDASLIAMIESEEGEPLNVGRKTRAISPALWRLLRSRDKGCRFPGCANSRYMDGHHIVHWANGGETKPSNLVCLCRFHHRAVHEGGIRIHVLDDGAMRFVRANGVVIDSTTAGCMQPRGDVRQLPAGVAAKWRGEKMDVGLGVEVLMQKVNRARDVPAGTSVGI